MYNMTPLISYFKFMYVYVMQLFTNSIKFLCCDIVLLGH